MTGFLTKHIKIKSRYLGVFLGLMNLQVTNAMAQELEYIGFPPPNKMFIEYKTEVDPIHFEVIGSLRPLTLLINGQPVMLKKSKEAGGIERSVMINNRVLELEGSSGRFYESLDLKSEADAKMLIRISKSTGELFESVLDLKLAFFDFPLKSRKVLQTQEGSSEISEVLELESIWDSSWSLYLNKGKVQIAGKQISIRLPVKSGRNYLNGKLRYPDGTVRTFNIPIEVRIDRHDSEKPYLVLPIVKDKKFKLQHGDLIIDGYTNPMAKVSLLGKDVVVSGEDGSFHLRYTARLPEEELTLSTDWNGQVLEEKYVLICEECVVEEPKNYQIGILYGLGEIDRYLSERHGFLFVYKSKWVCGFNEVSYFGTVEQRQYKSYNPNLGYQFRYDLKYLPMLEVGIQFRSVDRSEMTNYSGPYYSTQYTHERDIIAPFLRPEFIRGKYYSAGAHIDSAEQGKLRVFAELRLLYAF
jgi:hypothetical protein